MAYNDVIVAEEKYVLNYPTATRDPHQYTSIGQNAAEVCINHLKYLVKKKKIYTQT
jgi:hypothetical protein